MITTLKALVKLARQLDGVQNMTASVDGWKIEVETREFVNPNERIITIRKPAKGDDNEGCD